MDILNPIGHDEWELVEVKSSVEVKRVNLWDIAFQAYLIAGNELKLRRCVLMRLSRDYVRQGALEPKKMFILQDVTSQASDLSRSIAERLDGMMKSVGLRNCP